MNFSRRGLLSRAWTPLIAASPLLLAARAMADDTAQYLYDPLGRLVRVTLSDGTIVLYEYDAAGNRTQVIRSDGGPFNQTLQVTGSGPVNLRTIAHQAGYTGLTDATITFQVGSAVTIMGAPGAAGGSVAGIGIDTGLWPSSTYAISLILQVSGKIYGGGGAGGGGWEPGSGGAGGDAISCRENIAITVNSGGQVKGGGGGGGMGGGWGVSNKDPETGEWSDISYLWGGGGGGGVPNGPGGASGGQGGAGSAGTTSGGGAGGAGGAIGTRTYGAGGAGGGAATPGLTGANGGGTGGCGNWICHHGPESGGAGGAAGYAIRKNGKTVSVTNNGTIAGAVG